MSDPALIPYARDFGYPQYLLNCQALEMEPDPQYKHFAVSREDLIEQLRKKYTDSAKAS